MFTALHVLTVERGATIRWARPTRWRGRGMAICYLDACDAGSDIFCIAPTTVPFPAPFPVARDCFGEWELVDPRVVVAEHRRVWPTIPITAR